MNDCEKRSVFILVTGGQRSGKSVFAEKLALSMKSRPIYIATAHVYDDEMQKRVEIHKERRHEKWENRESCLEISDILFKSNDVVLIDCVTHWATNIFFEKNENVDESLHELKRQINILKYKKATFIFVTNEIGLGGISDNSMQRKFTDLQGLVNQYLSSLSEEVYFLVSGIPLKIK